MMTSVYAVPQTGLSSITPQPVPAGLGQVPYVQQPYGLPQLSQFGVSGGQPQALDQIVIDSAMRIAAIATSGVVEQLLRDPQVLQAAHTAGQLPPQAWSQLIAECTRRVTPIVAGIPSLVQSATGVAAPLAFGYSQPNPYNQQPFLPQAPFGQQPFGGAHPQLVYGQQFGGVPTQSQSLYTQQHAPQAQAPSPRALFWGIQTPTPGPQFGLYSPYVQQPFGVFVS